MSIRCILNLAAILSRDILQVSLGGSSNFKSSWGLIKFIAISLQIILSRISVLFD